MILGCSIHSRSHSLSGSIMICIFETTIYSSPGSRMPNLPQMLVCSVCCFLCLLVHCDCVTCFYPFLFVHLFLWLLVICNFPSSSLTRVQRFKTILLWIVNINLELLTSEFIWPSVLAREPQDWPIISFRQMKLSIFTINNTQHLPGLK